ncbi:MAG: hypothetical protein CME62_06665 [Halobacteriovoraceae bacterium]|nr:hypothetical protein [Halobacteriovoraceae bacterium]|tara:strand:- start:20145 stop:23777 length:3633 start_codon:yes stop_codon:yes gene_type:complete
MNKIFILLSLISIVFFDASAASFFGDNLRSQAYFEEGMVDTKRNFTEKHLMSNGYFDLMKIQLFMGRLEKEKEFFLSTMYETRLIREIEMQVSKPSNALEEAREEADEKSSDFGITFNEFLIPRISQLIEEVENNPNCMDVCFALLDEFFEIYSNFYSPDKYRNYFVRDYNWREFFNHAGGYTITRDQRKLEANNLIAHPGYLDRISNCLNKKVNRSYFFNQNELRMLKDCRFDLSLLDPGKSIYWKPKNNSLENVLDMNSHLYPEDHEKLYFKSVKFSGKGSPKIRTEFERGHDEYDVKLKIGGYEAHTENFLGRVGELIGFSQDSTQFRKTQEVIFEDKDDFNEFESFLYRKYGHRSKNFIYEMNDWGNEGGKIITFRNVSLEVEPKNLIKISSPDVFGWGRKNKREFRGALLWFGFFDLLDLKNANWRTQLVRTSEGLQPVLSLQDIGYSMGGGATFNSITQAPKIKAKSWNVNSFRDSFLVYDRDKVTVKWNDLTSYEKLFDTTTISDLKWMARKILKLSRNDIKTLLTESGFAQAEQILYFKKLSARRDEMVKAFQLEDEYPLWNEASYKTVNIPGVVQNGEVIDTSVGSVHEFTDDSTLMMIGQFIQRTISPNNFEQELQASIGNELGVTINPHLPINTIEHKDFTLYIARPGIEIGFSREVRPGQFVSYDNAQDQSVYAIDRYSFALTSRSGVEAALSQFFPVEMQATIKGFKFTIEHHRPYASAAKALKAPAVIMHVLPRLKEYIRYMKRNESITYSNDTEFEFKVRVGQGQNYRLQYKHERIKSQPVTVHKNEFAEIQIFQEKIRSRANYVEASVGVDIPLIYIPLLSVEYAFVNYEASSKMYHFEHESRTLNDAIEQYYHTTDQRLINELLDGNYNHPLLESKVKYLLETHGNMRMRRSRFALLFSGKRDEIYSSSSLTYEGDTKKFHRYYYASEDTLGLDNMVSAHVLWDKDKTTVEIQMDNEDPEDFVVIVNNFDFKKSLTSYGLQNFLNQQNTLYSGDKDFFRTDILPPADEVNHYKKVMSHVRVFLYGKGLMKKLDKLWDNELHTIIKRQLGTYLDPVDTVKARGIYNKLRTARTLHRQGKLNTKGFLQMVGKAIYGLKTREKGVYALKELFGKKHMFVMGEVYGIFPSYTYLQEHATVSDSRFTGSSWGKYRKRPPFWKFLKDFPIQVRPGMIPYRVNEELVFPQLPTGADESVF